MSWQHACRKIYVGRLQAAKKRARRCGGPTWLLYTMHLTHGDLVPPLLPLVKDTLTRLNMRWYARISASTTAALPSILPAAGKEGIEVASKAGPAIYLRQLWKPYHQSHCAWLR
jgi:hypothetical protein